MEQLMRWVAELNTSHHGEYAILTVLTMLGVGGFLASLIELVFIVLGVKDGKHGSGKRLTQKGDRRTERGDISADNGR